MHRLFNTSDESTLSEYLKLDRRPSAERRAKISELRKTAEQFDRDAVDEEVWYKNSLAQDAEISASEVEFFKVLRSQKSA